MIMPKRLGNPTVARCPVAAMRARLKLGVIDMRAGAVCRDAGSALLHVQPARLVRIRYDGRLASSKIVSFAKGSRAAPRAPAPTVVFFIAVQRYSQPGWGSGGIKGSRMTEVRTKKRVILSP